MPVALLILSALMIAKGVRSDATTLGFAFLWGLSFLQLLLAYGLFYLLVRETTPGRSARPALWVMTFVAVILAQLGVAKLSFARSPVVIDPESVLRIGAICVSTMSFIGLPVLAVFLVLASRGLPLRPRLTGLASGLVGGLVAEAIYRTHCPFTDIDHMFPWHTGAVALLGLVGFFAGTAWELARVRQWRQHRSSR